MPLFKHQVEPHKNLLDIQSRGRFSLDSSDTGTGKTYVAVQMAKDLNCQPFVVCPKAVISSWRRVCKELGVEPLEIINPEKLKTGKTGWVSKKGKKSFAWRIPDRSNTIIFFDEVHQYGSPNSQNSMLLASTKTLGCRVHCMSATLAETPLRLRGPGYLFGLHNWYDFYDWAARHGCYRNPWNGFEFSKGDKGKEALTKIHKNLSPYTVRVKVSDVEDFPEVTIQPEAYVFEDSETEKIQDAYDNMQMDLSNESQNPLVALLRARQEAEFVKSALVVTAVAEQVLEENRSVVVFCNFMETLKFIKEQLTTLGIAVCEIHGQQNAEQRDWNIQQFQDNHRYVCLSIVTAGGVGISLHDLKGRPRISYIFPPLTARDLKQCLGRIHRAGALSPAIQKIVFAAGTVEEDVCSIVRSKLNNLDLLNDAEISGNVLG